MTDDFIQGKILSSRVYPEIFPLDADTTVLNVGCGYAPQSIAYQGSYKHMVGIDITFDRLVTSLDLRKRYPMRHYEPLCGNVEQLPFATNSFDRAIAIDIIEHVRNPKQLCLEIHRVLKPQAQVLISFPAMHDKYTGAISWFARTILRRKSVGTFHDKSDEWHPDAHNQEFSVQEWLRLVESCGFRTMQTVASTLFPPLHLYGVPRFWFKSDFIHRIDQFFCRQAFLAPYGQALLGVFEKQG